MLRSHHDALLAVMEVNCELRAQLVERLQAEIADNHQKIQQLTELLTSAKCNDYTPKPPEKSKTVPFSNSRGGWRAKAEAASEATIPAPSDSAAKLEQRVKEQGGTV
jgi:hypothetical protein